jgi:hypothetical protein
MKWQEWNYSKSKDAEIKKTLSWMQIGNIDMSLQREGYMSSWVAELVA